MADKITSGNYDVVSWGSLLVFPGEDLSLQLQYKTLGKINIRFSFRFTDEHENHLIFFDNETNQDELNIILTNFNSVIGGGTLQPEEIVETEKETLYIHFRVAVSSDHGLQEITYTIFSKKKRRRSATAKTKQIK